MCLLIRTSRRVHVATNVTDFCIVGLGARGEIAEYADQVRMGMKRPRSLGVIITATRRARLPWQVTEHHGILRQIWHFQQRIHTGSISISARPIAARTDAAPSPRPLTKCGRHRCSWALAAPAVRLAPWP